MYEGVTMNIIEDIIKMSERLTAVEVKVDHLSEKIELSNKALDAHSDKTDKNFEEIGRTLRQQGDNLNRITHWLDTAPKILRIAIACILAATLFASNGWTAVFNLIASILK